MMIHRINSCDNLIYDFLAMCAFSYMLRTLHNATTFIFIFTVSYIRVKAAGWFEPIHYLSEKNYIIAFALMTSSSGSYRM